MEQLDLPIFNFESILLEKVLAKTINQFPKNYTNK